jgi:hypothetical protein
MDFGKLDVSKASEEGAWMVICDYSGAKTDARLKLVGRDSKAYKRARTKLAEQDRKET